jgi:predicted RNA-binding Zn-ribbon protein involved in translation (DUF1610 family)
MNVNEHSPVFCGNCGAAIQEPAGTLLEQRFPCPECGSLTRHIEMAMIVRSTTQPSLRAIAWRAGSKRKDWFKKIWSKLSYFHKTGEYHHLDRKIDRESDDYYEHITDASGNVVRHVDEPLTSHQGRGDAKRSKKKQGGPLEDHDTQ